MKKKRRASEPKSRDYRQAKDAHLTYAFNQTGKAAVSYFCKL